MNETSMWSVWITSGIPVVQTQFVQRSSFDISHCHICGRPFIVLDATGVIGCPNCQINASGTLGNYLLGGGITTMVSAVGGECVLVPTQWTENNIVIRLNTNRFSERARIRQINESIRLRSRSE